MPMRRRSRSSPLIWPRCDRPQRTGRADADEGAIRAGHDRPAVPGQMGTNKETFMKFLSEIKIKPEDKTALAKMGKKLKVMVITEDWCGDALYNVPVLFKLVEGNPDVELRVFLRDKNPDLMDQYLNKGTFRSIPVFAFFDENLHEIARLLERPQKLTEEI